MKAPLSAVGDVVSIVRHGPGMFELAERITLDINEQHTPDLGFPTHQLIQEACAYIEQLQAKLLEFEKFH